MSWIKESNRLLHLKYGAISSISFFTTYCIIIPFTSFWFAILVSSLVSTAFGIGLAIGKDYADKCWGGKFDWLDVIATVLGNLIGQIVQLFILSIWIYLI